MNNAPKMLITLAGKAHELDRDRLMPLTHEAAEAFASTANTRLSLPQTMQILGDDMGMFAELISAESRFPFRAIVIHGHITLFPALDKTDDLMLKDISNGVTEVYKKFVVRKCDSGDGLSEGKKFSLTNIFQTALYKAYIAAGLDTGPHTEYYFRGC